MNKYLIILGGLLASVFVACSGEKEDDLIDTLEKEKIAIHEYLRANATTPIVVVPYYSRKGMLIDSMFIYNVAGGGEVVKDTGWVMMNYDLLSLDGRIWDSTDPVNVRKLEAPGIPSYLLGGPVLHVVDTSKRYDYLAEAFRHIGVGGSGEILIPSMLAGTKNGQPRVYKLKSHRIIMNLVENEKALMQQVILSYRDSIVEAPILEAMGDTVTYVLVNKRGTGDRKVQPGDSLVIRTTSCVLDDWNLQNHVIRAYADTVETTIYTDKWKKTYPEGYLKGIGHLSQGDRAFIIVPYNMGFGAKGVALTIKNTTMKPFLVSPFSTLMYVVDVRKVAAPKSR